MYGITAIVVSVLGRLAGRLAIRRGDGVAAGLLGCWDLRSAMPPVGAAARVAGVGEMRLGSIDWRQKPARRGRSGARGAALCWE